MQQRDPLTKLTPTRPPGPKECAYKLLLVDDIRAAITEILKLHTDELEAVLSGDYSTSVSTAERLRIAREHKALMIERYRNHLLEHGC